MASRSPRRVRSTCYARAVTERAYPELTADLLRARSEQLERFARWEQAHAEYPATPSAAVAAIGTLYDLLPPNARVRPVDPRGVQAMHAALSRLRS